MQRPLSVQKKIDGQAVALAAAISFVLTVCAAVTMAAIYFAFFFKATPGVDDSIAVGMEFIGAVFMSVVVPFPFWLWAGFRIRKALNWPKGAFQRSDRVTE